MHARMRMHAHTKKSQPGLREQASVRQVGPVRLEHKSMDKKGEVSSEQGESFVQMSRALRW